MVQQSNDLFYRSRERKYKVMPLLLRLQDNEIDSGHYYVQVVDYMNEITKSLLHVTRPCFDHIDNNHEGMTREQIEDLMKINDEVETIFTRINVMLRNNDFAEHRPDSRTARRAARIDRRRDQAPAQTHQEQAVCRPRPACST